MHTAETYTYWSVWKRTTQTKSSRALPIWDATWWKDTNDYMRIYRL